MYILSYLISKTYTTWSQSQMERLLRFTRMSVYNSGRLAYRAKLAINWKKKNEWKFTTFSGVGGKAIRDFYRSSTCPNHIANTKAYLCLNVGGCVHVYVWLAPIVSDRVM